jgi:diguanylate cyclase (GGDEF)-like protein
MLRKFLVFSNQPMRTLLAPIGVRGRVTLATCFIMTPLLILLLLTADRQYRLAKMLQADGHATALSDTVPQIAETILLGLLWLIVAVAIGARAVELRVVRPMRHLTQAASRLAKGELHAEVDMSRIKMGEMRRLGATLNDMARILEKIALTDNDLYGHGAGDLCLRRIAQALQSTVRRPGDLVARYGGEEFAILLPDTDEEGGLTIARELLVAIRALAIPHAAWERGIVTISIGLAVSRPPPPIDRVVLMERADQALYGAKLAGRDRVLVSERLTHAA